MSGVEVLRYAAFTSSPAGGNPAGVVLDAAGLSEGDMLRIAAEVGYSETAFLVGRGGGRFDVRYFSPLVEVPFCGHATIASAVAYADRYGTGVLVFDTAAGPVEVGTAVTDAGVVATLTSVPPRVAAVSDGALSELLAALGWSREDLDPGLPVRVGYAGAFHPIVAAGSRARLAALDYDFDRLAVLMASEGWTTVQLVWRADASTFHARDPFPPGGVVEDPATGAAAAALGGYLRELGLVVPPARVTVYQGEDLGRPGVLVVDIPASGGVSVSGPAVALAW
ncbi:PhzF family phenazine biosynthesis protein [Pseudofrankia asymbiotica]|uniref:Phenazine biosynthesis protein PhzF n=1 Tax=Pseudofrankia asymbiotica TaxID=1834516 RepID=A0A1V2IIL8_9ACTN|nr:PhzF family phenazine biosynthesis isomerase [Pseudofrankia asymbiotica]ONH32875.1 phenazine biosynthesis protein PhzF [Pseudofrankia asymbiotica]